MDLNTYSTEITNYTVNVIIPIGLVFLSLSIFVFSRKNLNKTNMGFLYTWQCGADMAAILIYFLFIRISFGIGAQVSNLSDFSCRILGLVSRTSIHLPSWINVIISFDRFIQVHYRGRIVWIKSKIKLTVLILTTLFGIMICNIPNMLRSLKETQFQIRINNTLANRTLWICTFSDELTLATDILSTIVRTYLPFVLISTFNLILVKELFLSKVNLKMKNQRKEIQFTIVVLLISIAFFLFNSPISIVFIINNLFRFNESVRPFINSQLLSFVLNITTNLAYWYQCLNFFFNLMFNSLFRDEVLIILRIKKEISIASDSNLSSLHK